ncbi:hypothetical protein B566_EDAN003704 [Ephemera danica]|nr:hypothetical protein B566_EDAN003704 [Ephemera danica]
MNLGLGWTSFTLPLLRKLLKLHTVHTQCTNSSCNTNKYTYHYQKDIMICGYQRCRSMAAILKKLPQPESLSPKQMLEQSCIGVVAASVQLLQITTAAVLIASASYRKAMEAEMLLLKQSLEFVNVEFMQEGYNDLLIVARAEIQQTQKDLQELLGFMEYVEKTASSTAETSFLVGAEYSSLSLSDVLFDAQKRVAEQRVHTQSLETELRALQQQLVLKSQQKKKHLPEQEPILPTLPDS